MTPAPGVYRFAQRVFHVRRDGRIWIIDRYPYREVLRLPRTASRYAHGPHPLRGVVLTALGDPANQRHMDGASVASLWACAARNGVWTAAQKLADHVLLTMLDAGDIERTAEGWYRLPSASPRGDHHTTGPTPGITP